MLVALTVCISRAAELLNARLRSVIVMAESVRMPSFVQQWRGPGEHQHADGGAVGAAASFTLVVHAAFVCIQVPKFVASVSRGAAAPRAASLRHARCFSCSVLRWRLLHTRCACRSSPSS